MQPDLNEKPNPTVEYSEGGHPSHLTQPDHKESENPRDDCKWDFNVLENLCTLYMIIFIGLWCMGMPSNAIAFISARFPEEAHNSSWIATSALVASAVVSATVGNASDTLDRRSFLLAGCVIGGGGLLVSGLVNSLTMVIGGQVLNSVGSDIGFLSNPLL